MLLKFRAWDRKHARMIEATEPDWDGQGKREYRPLEISVGFSGWDKSQLEIMMSTGLTDQNGTLIYEGDILTDERGKIRREVFWDQENARFMVRPGKDDYIDYATKLTGIRFVTNNIYEAQK